VSNKEQQGSCEVVSCERKKEGKSNKKHAFFSAVRVFSSFLQFFCLAHTYTHTHTITNSLPDSYYCIHIRFTIYQSINQSIYLLCQDNLITARTAMARSTEPMRGSKPGTTSATTCWNTTVPTPTITSSMPAMKTIAWETDIPMQEIPDLITKLSVRYSLAQGLMVEVDMMPMH
jgi:hypothetical protein